MTNIAKCKASIEKSLKPYGVCFPAPHLDTPRLEIDALANLKAIPNPDSEILISLKASTDRMIAATWTAENDWTNTQLVPFGPIVTMPSASPLQHATQCFEGIRLFHN
jgi:branched-chain amino acid aminotransferase